MEDLNTCCCYFWVGCWSDYFLSSQPIASACTFSTPLNSSGWEMLCREQKIVWVETRHGSNGVLKGFEVCVATNVQLSISTLSTIVNSDGENTYFTKMEENVKINNAGTNKGFRPSLQFNDEDCLNKFG
ncbi:uncharacterized protein [Rutidosis leptorrhynchoides]|uniref:uncharacterized protein isoform X2 n=1 Tax=Rutidosis leptorrhynchoides TaxID=125765 RepID=UPI003A99EC5D